MREIHQNTSLLMVALLFLCGCMPQEPEDIPYVKPVKPDVINPVINFIDINSSEQYKKAIRGVESKKVVEYYHAVWCQYCRQQSPIIKELSQENKNVYFLKIDYDHCGEIASQNQIKSLPTIRIGSQKFVGLTSKQKIQDFLND